MLFLILIPKKKNDLFVVGDLMMENPVRECGDVSIVLVHR